MALGGIAPVQTSLSLEGVESENETGRELPPFDERLDLKSGLNFRVTALAPPDQCPGQAPLVRGLAQVGIRENEKGRKLPPVPRITLDQPHLRQTSRANTHRLAFPEAECSEAIRDLYTSESGKGPGSSRSDLGVGSLVRGRSEVVVDI